MTREQILALEGEDLNRAVAESVMGRRPGRACHGPVEETPGVEELWVCLTCGAGGTWGATEHEEPLYPYSEDIAAAWQVEEEIRRRARTHEGLAHEYAHHLRALSSQACLAGEPGETSLGLDWETLHAPPDRRCRAALLAVLGVPKPAPANRCDRCQREMPRRMGFKLTDGSEVCPECYEKEPPHRRRFAGP